MTALVSLLEEAAAQAEEASELDEPQFPHGAFQSSNPLVDVIEAARLPTIYLDAFLFMKLARLLRRTPDAE